MRKCEKRPGKAGPKGRRRRYQLKFGTSSSGCKTHPAKAEPGKPVVRPCAVVGNHHGDA